MRIPGSEVDVPLGPIGFDDVVAVARHDARVVLDEACIEEVERTAVAA